MFARGSTCRVCWSVGTTTACKGKHATLHKKWRYFPPHWHVVNLSCDLILVGVRVWLTLIEGTLYSVRRETFGLFDISFYPKKQFSTMVMMFGRGCTKLKENDILKDEFREMCDETTNEWVVNETIVNKNKIRKQRIMMEFFPPKRGEVERRNIPMNYGSEGHAHGFEHIWSGWECDPSPCGREEWWEHRFEFHGVEWRSFGNVRASPPLAPNGRSARPPAGARKSTALQLPGPAPTHIRSSPLHLGLI